MLGPVILVMLVPVHKQKTRTKSSKPHKRKAPHKVRYKIQKEGINHSHELSSSQVATFD